MNTAPEPAMTWKGRLIAVFTGALIFFALAEGFLRVVYPQWREFSSARFMTVEMVPGHGVTAVGRAGFDGYFAQNNGDFRAAVAVNAHGLRNPEPVQAADGRVWFIGDSMTFGWGVEQNEMYSSLTGAMAGAAAYNVASPGTDVCGYQALAARMPQGVAPAAVIVGLVLENDILEYDCKAAARAAENQTPPGDDFAFFSLLHWKVWFTRVSALYNFFAVSVKRVGGLTAVFKAAGLINPDHHKAKFVAEQGFESAALATASELSRLHSMLGADVPFAVIVIPSRFEIRDNDAYWRGLRLAVTAALNDAGVDVIDPLPGFKARGFAATHFAHDGHWNTAGHEAAAKAAAVWLRAQRSAGGETP